MDDILFLTKVYIQVIRLSEMSLATLTDSQYINEQSVNVPCFPWGRLAAHSVDTQG